MFRFNDKVEDLFTPTMEGVTKERFSYLVGHRQSMPADKVMQNLLGGLALGEGEHLLVMCSGVNHTRHIHANHKQSFDVILGSLTTEQAPLEHWATYMATVMTNIKAAGTKVGAVILDGVIDPYVEALAVAALNKKHDMPNPINLFYRQMRGLVCALNELPLIVRHPLRHDSVLPSYHMTELVRYGWYLGSRSLDQEFDAAALIYEEGDDVMAVRGKLRGDTLPVGEQPRRVKL